MKKQVGCIDVQGMCDPRVGYPIRDYTNFALISVRCATCTVPPDIINEESSADLAVQEGEDATLTCRATGNPQPRVIWRREDGEMILIRKPGSRELMKGATSCSACSAS